MTRFGSNKLNIVTAILIVVFLLSNSFPAIDTVGASVGAWSKTSTYPIDVLQQWNCVLNGRYAYCVGGEDQNGIFNSVYYAKLQTTGGIASGRWDSTTSYPTDIGHESCVSNSGYIYCIGGDNASNVGPSDQVDFARVLSSGGIVGNWQQTTDYPTGIVWQECIVNSGFVYCMGGSPDGSSPGNSVYYAKISSKGITAWQVTANYPTIVEEQSCADSGAYIYCIGGLNFTSDLNSVYYAKLSPNGGVIGSWQMTTNYPVPVYLESCVTNGNLIYCIGGDSTNNPSVQMMNSVYYAKLSKTGGIVGSWKESTSYPTLVDSEDCLGYSSYVYCIGGENITGGLATPTNAVYYAKI